jgi:hypothetical protein
MTEPPTRRTPLDVAFDKPWPTTSRGLKLWLFAIALGIKGVGYLQGNSSHSTESALRLFTERLHVPLTACGAVIVILCAFAVVCSYCHYGRDRYGYMALTGFCAAWAAAFAVSPLFLDGPSFAWQGTITYAMFGVVLLLCASDPDHTVPRTAPCRPGDAG